MADEVLYRKDDGVARLTLNRPEVLNAVNLAMRDQLWDYLQAVRDDPDVRVAIIAGEGRSFCAGADISEFGSAPSLVAARRARRQRDLWGLLLAIDKPLISAIHGYALGAGCEMALCCDFRVASNDAMLGLPEVRLGYIPSAGGTQLLPRTVRGSLARQMIMTGEPISAERALRAGLLSRVVDQGALSTGVDELAAGLAALPWEAVAAAKRALSAARETSLEAGLAVESGVAGGMASR